MNKQLLIILLMVLASSVIANEWPTDGWQRKSLSESGIDLVKFRDFENYVFAKNAEYKTNSVLIIKDGFLVFEKYANGFKETDSQRWWSVSKSVTNALIARAIELGKINKNDSLKKFIPSIKTNHERPISIVDLLQMSSGLEWSEGYESAFWKSDVVAMLYTPKGFNGMGEYTSIKNAKYKPGERWNYSSGETNLLMLALKNAVGQELFNSFPWQELFNKIGVKRATWEMDLSQTFVGSSYLYMPLTDMAKIAYLYLKDGVWNGHRLFPVHWIKFTKSLAPAVSKTKLPGKYNRESYGAHWWLNVDMPEKKEQRFFPDAPADIYYASGHHGQHVIILPSQNMIVLRTATDKDEAISVNQYLKKLLQALK